MDLEGPNRSAVAPQIHINRPDKISADLTAGFDVGFVATSVGHHRNPGPGGWLSLVLLARRAGGGIARLSGEHEGGRGAFGLDEPASSNCGGGMRFTLKLVVMQRSRL